MGREGKKIMEILTVKEEVIGSREPSVHDRGGEVEGEEVH